MSLAIPILSILVSVLCSILLVSLLVASAPNGTRHEVLRMRLWGLATGTVVLLGTTAAIWAIRDERMLLACALGIAPGMFVAGAFGYLVFRGA